MKKFENVPKAMVRFYFTFLIGLILSIILFVSQIVFDFIFVNYDALLLIMLSFLGLFKVSSSAIYEIKKTIKKHRI